MRFILKILLVLLLLMAGGAALVVADYRQWQHTAVHQETEDRYLDITPGTPFRGVVAQLEREGLLVRTRYFEFLARYRGDAGKVRAGEYRIPAGMTPPQVLERLISGQVIQYAFTLVEGWTFSQLRAALSANPRILTTLQDLDDAQVMARLGHPDRHPEGWFYPETYYLTRGATDEDILRRAMGAMETQLQQIWQSRAEELPIENPYEALILASIIERETGQPSERGTIAGVFSRRLQQGMRLQTDPTVIYGMGDAYEGRIRTRDLRRDTPYNTYTRHGLPPTPIAMPGGAAIRAAVNPEPGDALYFVSRGDGSHHFSATYDEHRGAVRRYILGKQD